MAGKITASLVLDDAEAKRKLNDLRSYVAKLGFKSLEQAIGQQPQLAAKIAKEIGVPFEFAVRQGIERGIGGGLKVKRIPPIIPPPLPFSGRPPPVISGSQSSLQGRLSSYLFGRTAANLALGNFGGGIAGGVGLVASSGGPFGQGAAIAASAAIALANALRHLVEMLKQWAEIGAKLFQRAAKVGLSSGQTFLAQSYAALLGVSPETLETLMLNSEFGGRRARGSVGSIPGIGNVSGRGAQGAGDIQQFANLAPSLSQFFASIRQDLQIDSAIAKQTAGYSERVSLGFTRVFQEFELFKMEAVQGFAPALNAMTNALTDFLHAINVITFAIRNNNLVQAAIAGLAGASGPGGFLNSLYGMTGQTFGQNNARNSPFTRGTASGLEKIGLVFGAGQDRVLSTLQKIEHNTRGLLHGNHDPLNLLGAPQHNTP
jgi:hypothetical protein